MSTTTAWNFKAERNDAHAKLLQDSTQKLIKRDNIRELHSVATTRSVWKQSHTRGELPRWAGTITRGRGWVHFRPHCTDTSPIKQSTTPSITNKHRTLRVHPMFFKNRTIRPLYTKAFSILTLLRSKLGTRLELDSKAFTVSGAGTMENASARAPVSYISRFLFNLEKATNFSACWWTGWWP